MSRSFVTSRLASLWLLEALGAAFLFAPRALADGAYIQDQEALVETAEQRAVVWVREDRLEIHLQTSYEGAPGDFGWLVPVPDVPEVAESSPGLLDDLDLLTAPLFHEFCYCCCESTGFCPAGGAEGEEQESTVTVWTTGTVGALDFSVISATDAAALETWLEDNGFQLPDGSTETLEHYSDRGYAFFAARLSPGGDAEGANDPVRLTLPGGTAPMFPMRLTALSATEPVPVLLWVVADQPYLPSTYPHVLVADRELRRSDYEALAAELYRDHDGSTFIVQYARALTLATPYDDRLEHEVPEGWRYEELDPLVQQMLDAGDVVTRLSARLDPRAMTDDVLLEPAEVEEWNHFFVNVSGPQCCDYCPDSEPGGRSGGCAAVAGRSGSGPDAAILLALGALVSLALAWRRARRPGPH